MNNLPIGVFDSGIGGLTVLKELIKTLPQESFIYLGDTARVPYGTRDKQTIANFALELVDYLLKKNVKALVVACNTISATCLEEIKKISPVPVIGVIEPTVELAVEKIKGKRIGVIGTRATIRSQSYELRIKSLNKKIEVILRACPLFVPLVEEGLFDSLATRIIAEDYLKIFKVKKVDALILGCTHYPLLKDLIQEIMGDVLIIDSAQATAQVLEKTLDDQALLSSNTTSSVTVYLTDESVQTKKIINFFLEPETAFKLEKINLYHSSSSKTSSSDGLDEI